MFPEYRDLITRLKHNDRHFTQLFERHNELDQKIHNIETHVVPGTSLEIEDEGRGSGGSSGGFGLTGLRERLEAIGGRLHAANRPEGGFLLRAEIPSP